ncbi:MAG: 3-phosphoshikimate 1-carboxyvinyltransferase, partial [Candidatus Marinimicrobia bacterium]|nr:3-phosphoshikimate 1-carboxyvinyltransferase [Candidatus Neomarinimicrobiota bacterium]
VSSPAFSRDHTEQMLKSMGAKIKIKGRKVTVSKLTKPLRAIDLSVPGDFSAAAFFIAAASLVPDSDLIIRGVGVNPSRIAFLNVVQEMGGDITLANQAEIHGEAVADLRIRSSKLRGIQVFPEQIANLIDELPLIAVLASQAEGETVVVGAEELRVKESDRIEAIVSNLARWGAKIFERSDGFNVEGPTPLLGGEVITFDDHRIAMSLGIASLVSKAPARFDNPACVDISYPGFFDELRSLMN